MKKNLVFIVIASLLYVIEGSAQTLNGRVYDNMLDPIEGVAVSLSQQGDTIAMRHALTDGAGVYCFPKRPKRALL